VELSSPGSDDPGVRLSGPTILSLLLTDRRQPGLQPSEPRFLNRF
jgi:hypothetical protein